MLDVVGSYLGFLHRSGVLVAHGADLHAALSLPVTLVEELVHDAVCPLSVKVQRLGGVTEIGTVDHITQDLRTSERFISVGLFDAKKKSLPESHERSPVSCRCSGPAVTLLNLSPSWSPPWSLDPPASSCVWTYLSQAPNTRKRSNVSREARQKKDERVARYRRKVNSPCR